MGPSWNHLALLRPRCLPGRTCRSDGEMAAILETCRISYVFGTGMSWSLCFDVAESGW
jgi:hypothetical protein